MGRLLSRPNEAIDAAITPQPLPSPPTTSDIANPGTILVILKGVAVATTTIYHAIDRALELELEHEGQQVLKNLRRVVEILKSDTAVYETLMKAMDNDTHPISSSDSPYTRLIQQWVTGL